MTTWCGPVLLLFLVGCSTLDAEEQAVFEASIEQSEAIGDTGNAFADFADEEQSCIESGVDGLDVGTLLGDASRSGDTERAALMQVVLDCVEEPEQADSFAQSMAANFAAGLGADVTLDEGRCITRYIIDNSANPARAIAVGSDPEDAEVALAALEACLPPDTIDEALGVAGTGPQNYGDDADLDLLYDDCEAGRNEACDLLFFESSAESEYETFATSCGGRSDGFSWCTPGLAFDDDGVPDPVPELLPRLREECGAGDMTSCDLLRRLAGLGSDDESFGATCGERIPGVALPSCRARFGAVVLG
jgi:hypothetical protein